MLDNYISINANGIHFEFYYSIISNSLIILIIKHQRPLGHYIKMTNLRPGRYSFIWQLAAICSKTNGMIWLAVQKHMEKVCTVYSANNNKKQINKMIDEKLVKYQALQLWELVQGHQHNGHQLCDPLSQFMQLRYRILKLKRQGKVEWANA